MSDFLEEEVDAKYTLGKGTWRTLERHKAHHQSAGNGFGYGLMQEPFDSDDVVRTISARYHKDGAEVLIDQGEGQRPRRLSPLECLRLMGFPDRYLDYFDPNRPLLPQPVSDTQAYRQAGNSVVVPLVSDIARAVISALTDSGCLPWRSPALAQNS